MIKLASLLTDGVVLQQQQPIRVWGECAPRTLVKAEIAGNSAYAKSSCDGSFMLHLPPLDAGGAFELTVSLPDVPGETVTVHDVLIGEVWMCSGQSNMLYTLGCDWAKLPPPPPGVETLREQQKNEFIETFCPAPQIRFITVPMVVTGCREKYFDASWKPMTGENAPGASAVAAWFAAMLRQKINVPVGLICCSWGRAMVDSWTSPSALRRHPDSRKLLELWEELRSEKHAWEGDILDRLLNRIAEPDRGNEGFDRKWAEPDFDDSSWRQMDIPGSWIGSRISGNGAVWVRKKVFIPPEAAGCELTLKTGGIDKHDITYFNGVEVGRTGKGLEVDHWNLPREYKIPGELVRAGENTIAIRAFSFISDGAFRAPESDWLLCGKGVSIPLCGTWRIETEYDIGYKIMPPRMGVDADNTPGIKFESMIYPLLPFVIRGVLWYQGESNANFLSDALKYQSKFKNMILDWRQQWDLPELPFILVQLAEYRQPAVYDETSPLAALRGAQEAVCRTLAQTFMVTALGTGEVEDIHPQNKKEIGERLAAAALCHIYGEKVLPGGPVFCKAEPAGNRVRLCFDYAENMELTGDAAQSFFIAGENREYYPADEAEICGDTITLASKSVAEPRYVRYAWSDHPVSILKNREYPAAAFGSDEAE